MKKYLSFIKFSSIAIANFIPLIVGAQNVDQRDCKDSVENIEYVKLFSGFHIYSTRNIERNHYGKMLEDSGVYLRDRKRIETFMNELQSCPFERNLEKDVYDVCAELVVIAGRFVGPIAKEEPSGYAIIRWKCTEPELIWFLGERFYRGSKQFNSTPELYDFIIEEFKQTDHYKRNKK